jgi:hypothetical protein
VALVVLAVTPSCSSGSSEGTKAGTDAGDGGAGGGGYEASVTGGGGAEGGALGADGGAGSEASVGGGGAEGGAASGNDGGAGSEAGALVDGGSDGGGMSTGADATSPSDGSSTSVPEGSAGGTCLGSSLLGKVGKSHLLVGGTFGEAVTATMAPFDLQYVYISGGLSDGTGPCTSCTSDCTTGGGATSCGSSSGCAWWGCWQDPTQPPGGYVTGFASTCAGEKPPQIPMISYYELLQSSGVTEGAPEVTQAATNATFMARYLSDWRFLLKQIGSSVAFLHIEPDFWGYAEQQGSDPTMLPAAVATANATDCSALPNTIAGMGQCMIAMTRKYAPHALVGLQASAWSTNIDVAGNTSASLDVAGEAQKTAAFLAACGESQADFVVVETSDRDAGYYQTVEMKQSWWDPTNATLPNFQQDLTWIKALTEALQIPALYWQTPLGNAAQTNVTDHYQDNRVDYFFGGSAAMPNSAAPMTVPAHWNDLAAAHVIGAAFGAGAGDQTTPETDGNHLVTKANAYFSGAGGGQTLCP